MRSRKNVNANYLGAYYSNSNVSNFLFGIYYTNVRIKQLPLVFAFKKCLQTKIVYSWECHSRTIEPSFHFRWNITEIFAYGLIIIIYFVLSTVGMRCVHAFSRWIAAAFEFPDGVLLLLGSKHTRQRFIGYNELYSQCVCVRAFVLPTIKTRFSEFVFRYGMQRQEIMAKSLWFSRRRKTKTNQIWTQQRLFCDRFYDIFHLFMFDDL